MTKPDQPDISHSDEAIARGREQAGEAFIDRAVGRLLRAERALRETEERFRAIADYTYDWETWVGVDGKARWINRAVKRMTGYTVGECLSMPDYPLGLVHPKDREEIARHLEGAARGSEGNDITFRILRRDGSTCWAAVSWQPIYDSEGEPLGYRTSVRDICQRKLAEDALHQARAEAERANRSKSAFVAAASHDLRQPIQAIATFLAVLKMTAREAESQRIIKSIEECLRAASDLLDALLDVSRFDSGVLKAEPRVVAVGDLLERVEAAFADRARDKGLDLRFVASSALVYTDPTLMSEVIGNLVSNAIRYTERGGIVVGCRRRASKLRVEVWDTGVGIPADQQQRIFEEFYQIANPARDRKRGLGLGLTIVDRIARLLDAPLEVRSEPGKGSVFAIEVPLAEEPVEGLSLRAAKPRSSPLDGLVILAIDDEPLQLSALKALFERWGCKVLTAASRQAALVQLRSGAERPNVILADYRLGEGVTGAEAIRQVNAELGVNVPGVILTGDTDPARLAEAQTSGYLLLHKPVDPEELRDTLATLRMPSGHREDDRTDRARSPDGTEESRR